MDLPACPCSPTSDLHWKYAPPRCGSSVQLLPTPSLLLSLSLFIPRIKTGLEEEGQSPVRHQKPTGVLARRAVPGGRSDPAPASLPGRQGPGGQWHFPCSPPACVGGEEARRLSADVRSLLCWGPGALPSRGALPPGPSWVLGLQRGLLNRVWQAGNSFHLLHSL